MQRVGLSTAVLAITSLLVAPLPATAQDFPSRALTMVIPFSAAGGVDVVGRIMAARMGEILKQTVVVENIGGAGGMIGSARIARGAPDGYQFVLGSVGTHAQNQTLYKKPLYNAATDFAPITLVAEQPIVLTAKKDLPASTLAEFIAYTKANGAKMQYASPGSGSSSHLGCALFNAAAGLKVTHIPYRASATNDLIAGRIDYQCPTGAVAIPLVENNLVRPIATFSLERAARLPQVPTAHEQGLTGFEAYIWYALFAPKGTPAAIVQRLNAAANEAMNTPFVTTRLAEVGAVVPAPERRTPAYLQKFIEGEIAKWEGPIRAAGVSVE